MQSRIYRKLLGGLPGLAVGFMTQPLGHTVYKIFEAVLPVPGFAVEPEGGGRRQLIFAAQANLLQATLPIMLALFLLYGIFNLQTQTQPHAPVRPQPARHSQNANPRQPAQLCADDRDGSAVRDVLLLSALARHDPSRNTSYGPDDHHDDPCTVDLVGRAVIR